MDFVQFCCQKRAAWDQTPLNNELFFWLDNWSYNEGEKEKTESNHVWAAQSAPYFFAIALGARYPPPAVL